MKRWEYLVVSFYAPLGDVTEKANAFGAEGWELVTIDRADNWCFKRSVEEETVRPEIVPELEKRRVHHSALTGRQRSRKLL